jgi:hypothetical protein
MGKRTDLDAVIRTLLGSSNVYFQPPNGLAMKYPCIVYERSGMHARRADNLPYYNKKRYTITVIDRNPDSLIPDKVAKLDFCSFDRHFTSENLNHDVFVLYF